MTEHDQRHDLGSASARHGIAYRPEKGIEEKKQEDT